MELDLSKNKGNKVESNMINLEERNRVHIYLVFGKVIHNQSLYIDLVETADNTRIFCTP